MSKNLRTTVLDRLIGYFSPEKGVSRIRHRAMMDAMGGYKGGGRRSQRQSRGWRPFAGSADADTLPDIPDLRARSRDLARNAPIATGAIATTTTHVIGTGLVPHASIDRNVLSLSEERAADWERTAEREFRIWSREADFSGVLHFDQMQELVFRSVLESGDVLAVRRARSWAGSNYQTKIQLIEADRISNPNRVSDRKGLAGGVQTDADGRPVAYHVSDRHPGDLYSAGLNWRAIPARYTDGRPICLHVADRLRIDQTRGVPYLAPVVEALKELDRYTEAEVRAAVVSAMFTVFIGQENQGANNVLEQMQGEQGSRSGLAQDEIGLGHGAVIGLNPGEKIDIANPGRPNPAFDPFVMSLLRQIGVALELPFELLIKHFTASYSASRAALEMAYVFFKRRRHWMVCVFNAPVYEMFLEEAIAMGRLDAPGFFTDPVKRAAWLGCTWVGPARMSLDPLKDAKADEVDMASGAKTLQQVCTERTGGEWDRKLQQRNKERQLCCDLGLKNPRIHTDEEIEDEDDD